MDIEAKDKYIADHLMKLEPDTLRFMVADLTAEVDRLTSLCANYREALHYYAKHEKSCDIYITSEPSDCTCGLMAALQADKGE